MCITMTTFTLTYMLGANMVTTYPIWHNTQTMYNIVIFIWLALLGLLTPYTQLLYTILYVLYDIVRNYI